MAVACCEHDGGVSRSSFFVDTCALALSEQDERLTAVDKG
jgi:hypothetical protein